MIKITYLPIIWIKRRAWWYFCIWHLTILYMENVVPKTRYFNSKMIYYKLENLRYMMSCCIWMDMVFINVKRGTYKIMGSHPL